MDNSSHELVITVNVTCMMVLASIYLSISARLPSPHVSFVHVFSPELVFSFISSLFLKSCPPTATIKTIEIWLLFNLAYPFLVIMVNIMLQVSNKRLVYVLIDSIREQRREKRQGRR